MKTWISEEKIESLLCLLPVCPRHTAFSPAYVAAYLHVLNAPLFFSYPFKFILNLSPMEPVKWKSQGGKRQRKRRTRRMALWVSRAVPCYKCCPTTQWITSGAKQGVLGIIQSRYKRMWQKEQGLRRQSCVHMNPVSTTSSSGRWGWWGTAHWKAGVRNGKG